MSRPRSKQPKTRITLEFTVPVRERMERIKDRLGADSVTEVIRRSILLYEAVLEAGALRIVSKDDREHAILPDLF